MSHGYHGNSQACPSEDSVSLRRNTRRAPKDVEIGPVLVITNAEAFPVTVVRGDPCATPDERAAFLDAHRKTFCCTVRGQPSRQGCCGYGKAQKIQIGQDRERIEAMSTTRTTIASQVFKDRGRKKRKPRNRCTSACVHPHA